jgi:hypothetical protein
MPLYLNGCKCADATSAPFFNAADPKSDYAAVGDENPDEECDTSNFPDYTAEKYERIGIATRHCFVLRQLQSKHSMTRVLSRLTTGARYFLAVVLLIVPQLLLAQEAAAPAEASSGEEGGGWLKSIIGFLLVIVGVGLGVAAVVVPTKAGLPQPAKKKV